MPWQQGQALLEDLGGHNLSVEFPFLRGLGASVVNIIFGVFHGE